jgi:ADP-ribose pyrophosphatase YjhB (NUDIX family)
LLHFYWRFSRGATLGVRALVRDGEGRIFLVKHSYVTGWYLPGGGVEAGETMGTALARELREEGNIELTGPARLFAVYFNNKVSRRDHVALFVVDQCRQSAPPRRNAEIIDHGFFAPDALPDDTTDATRARIAEVLRSEAPSDYW